MRAFSILLISLVLAMGCDDSSTNSAGQTKTELLIGSWKINRAFLESSDITAQVQIMKATFTATEYSYTFPSEANVSVPDTQTGTWSWNETETQIILDRSNYDLEPWSWNLIILTPGNLQTSYIGPNPLGGGTANFRFEYIPDTN